MRIAIIGTGYVGLSTGICLASIGHDVICVDRIAERVDAINSGNSPFYEPRLPEMLSSQLLSGRLRATTDLGESVSGSDVILITVGTPQNDHGIDLISIVTVAEQVGSALRYASDYKVVAVKSTVVPGTTDTIVREILEEASRRKAGEFGLCMNPEFLREGSAIEDFMNPDRIVIGQWDDKSGMVMGEMYEQFNCPKVFTTIRNAEMIKYASNSLLAALISFSNEIAAICEATPQTDARVVLDVVGLDRRLSPVVDGRRIRPAILDCLCAGCGFGGSCLPKDVNALRAYARELDITPHMLDAISDVNANRPTRLGVLVEEMLGSVAGTTVAVLGLAFKPHTDDIRESPALKVISHLLRGGAAIRTYDPIIASVPPFDRFDDRVVCCNHPGAALQDADAAVLVTAWPVFAQWDWAALCASMRTPVIIDGRNALRDVSLPETVQYVGIGRMNGNGRPHLAVRSAI